MIHDSVADVTADENEDRVNEVFQTIRAFLWALLQTVHGLQRDSAMTSIGVPLKSICWCYKWQVSGNNKINWWHLISRKMNYVAA